MTQDARDIENKSVLGSVDSLMLDDISSELNGFARIVTYANHSIPE